jgi:hypothetical protein
MRLTASLCCPTTCGVQRQAIGPWQSAISSFIALVLCKMLHTYFGELPFHALRWIASDLARRLLKEEPYEGTGGPSPATTQDPRRAP